MPEINHKTYIKVPLEEVYITVSTSQGWNAWFTDETSLEINPDGTGEIRLRWTNFGSENVNIEDGEKYLRQLQTKNLSFNGHQENKIQQ
ncbi:hypothetical protein M1K46_23770 [Fictibacillus sp. WQ 8-8]|uniref:hypothetical protein n=1 Tax=Fictibacillus sp. WQ 8-8 TaxID=2938788 RepID=UPI00210DE87B|nr:hypothetical protein [Fictibacillus sp. WQ 8-8]MCQ6268599.1 hypothetical protein [Fictibacillus sp. WQ 8-8]